MGDLVVGVKDDCKGGRDFIGWLLGDVPGGLWGCAPLPLMTHEDREAKQRGRTGPHLHVRLEHLGRQHQVPVRRAWSRDVRSVHKWAVGFTAPVGGRHLHSEVVRAWAHGAAAVHGEDGAHALGGGRRRRPHALQRRLLLLCLRARVRELRVSARMMQ
eukprot:5392749-Pyramimonas_sp.AAC.2